MPPGDPIESEPRLIGASPAIREVLRLVDLIAPRDINVLITGESGTGKELVARAILRQSPRADRPYLAVNCAAIPETLLESELFGHERGAFTGAEARRIGRFEQCDGGTLFLDEIGDIPLATQAKLLRVLQDRTFQRLGGTETVQCDVRIIAATHQPLEDLIAQRRFRQDLYYRLKVAHLHLPPLREREVDAVLLAHHFVERFNPRLGTSIRGFDPTTLPLLLRHPWPGNVRELENAIKSALVLAHGEVMLPEFLPEEIRRIDGGGSPSSLPSRAGEPERTSPSPKERLAGLFERADLHGRIHATAIGLAERDVIALALERHRGRVAPAARALGISPTTLRARIRRYDLGVRVVGPRPDPSAPPQVE